MTIYTAKPVDSHGWVSYIHFMSWFLILEILGTIGTLMTGRFLMMYILSSDISLATVISYWIAVLCMVAGVAYIHAYYKNIILHRLAAVADGQVTDEQIMSVGINPHTMPRIFWGSLIAVWVPYIVSFAIFNITRQWNEDDNIVMYTTLMTLLSFILLYFYVRFYVWAAVVVEEDEGLLDAFKISYRLTRGSFWRLAFTLLLPYIFIIATAIIGGALNVNFIGTCLILLIMLAISSWYYPAQVLILTDLYLREEVRKEKEAKKRKSF